MNFQKNSYFRHDVSKDLIEATQVQAAEKQKVAKGLEQASLVKRAQAYLDDALFQMSNEDYDQAVASALEASELLDRFG